MEEFMKDELRKSDLPESIDYEIRDIFVMTGESFQLLEAIFLLMPRVDKQATDLEAGG